ncbi:Aste57867_16947 [Aphanomyces stellatus]|uniref:Aste57867_16947 protein n=1 Tax=Aphanomyces stellatus TaxID=120398 RepID=A0A485L8I0_9STRA|nr:hypothetical protein As57867_016889 [Aphanomyces stellatus]VFT93709.1 Aste57867_16947 [Aphanomyces stellatus]
MTHGLTVRLNLRYTVPAASSICDLFDLLHSHVWVAFISNQLVPYLKHSTPADPSVLRHFQPSVGASDACCVICMGSLRDAIQAPCGHRFHADCISSWLKLRSTCPSCRHQFPKEICGSYALRGINTALVLPPQCLGQDVMAMNLQGLTLRTIVHVTLVQVASPVVAGVKFACELNAVLVGDKPDDVPPRRGRTTSNVEKRKQLVEMNVEIMQKLKARRAAQRGSVAPAAAAT